MHWAFERRSSSSKHCGKVLHESSTSPSSYSSSGESSNGVKCERYLKDGLWGEKCRKHPFSSSSKHCCGKELHESSTSPSSESSSGESSTGVKCERHLKYGHESGQYDGNSQEESDDYWSLSDKEDSLSDEEYNFSTKRCHACVHVNSPLACSNYKRMATKDIRRHLKSLSKDGVRSLLKSLSEEDVCSLLKILSEKEICSLLKSLSEEEESDVCSHFKSLSDEEVRRLLKSLSEEEETVFCCNFRRRAVEDIRGHLKSLSKNKVRRLLKSLSEEDMLSLLKILPEEEIRIRSLLKSLSEEEESDVRSHIKKLHELSLSGQGQLSPPPIPKEYEPSAPPIPLDYLLELQLPFDAEKIVERVEHSDIGVVELILCNGMHIFYQYTKIADKEQKASSSRGTQNFVSAHGGRAPAAQAAAEFAEHTSLAATAAVQLSGQDSQGHIPGEAVNKNSHDSAPIARDDSSSEDNGIKFDSNLVYDDQLARLHFPSPIHDDAVKISGSSDSDISLDKSPLA